MGGFKLGKMTLGSLFKKPETVCYPAEKKEAPAGLKGHIVNDVSVCIVCGICQRRCPCAAITSVFAVQFGYDEDLAAGSVVITTFISIVVLPLCAMALTMML